MTPSGLIHDVQLLDGNANGGLDANECAYLVITLRNPTDQTFSDVTAVLTTTTPNVVVDPAPRSFPDLSPGETGACTAPFLITTTSDFSCGSKPTFVLHVVSSDSNHFDFDELFQLNTEIAGVGAPNTFTSTNVPQDIPDLGTADSGVLVQGMNLPLARVKVSLYITHTYDQDLRLSLISPDGTEVLLSSSNGQFGQNYGVDCDDTTTFSDDASNSIDSAYAPFLGTFIPEQPLASFNGKSGDAVNGVWLLRAEDQAAEDTGTIQCWSLELSPISCYDGGGQCPTPPQITLNPTDQVATNGDNVNWSVVAQGTEPLGYQWYFEGTNALVQGTNATLELAEVSPVDSGVYQVVVTNLYGSVTSAPAQLLVVVPAAIVSGPTDQVATNGDIVNWSVVAQGTEPLGYQWYFEGTNALVQGTNASLELANVSPADSGSYQVVVTNLYGSVTSAPAQLLVVVPAAIVSGPADQVATNGDIVNWTVVAQGTEPLGYQWYFEGTNALVQGTNASLELVGCESGGLWEYTR